MAAVRGLCLCQSQAAGNCTNTLANSPSLPLPGWVMTAVSSCRGAILELGRALMLLPLLLIGLLFPGCSLGAASSQWGTAPGPGSLKALLPLLPPPFLPTFCSSTGTARSCQALAQFSTSLKLPPHCIWGVGVRKKPQKCRHSFKLLLPTAASHFLDADRGKAFLLQGPELVAL